MFCVTLLPVADQSSIDQLSVIPPRSRAEQLADTLAAHISRQGLRPGDRVGTLDEIRAEVGFARSTVSEAVRLLRERGVLEIRPGRSGGLFVADETPVIRMRHTLLTARASTGSVREAIELREALEEPVAVSAAGNCTDADARELRHAVTRMHECGTDYNLFMQRNWSLHERVAQLCTNSMMGAVYTSCLGYLSRSAARYGDADEVADYIRERARVHRDLVEAVIAGDARAIRQAVAEHDAGGTPRPHETPQPHENDKG